MGGDKGFFLRGDRYYFCVMMVSRALCILLVLGSAALCKRDILFHYDACSNQSNYLFELLVAPQRNESKQKVDESLESRLPFAYT